MFELEPKSLFRPSSGRLLQNSIRWCSASLVAAFYLASVRDYLLNSRAVPGPSFPFFFVFFAKGLVSVPTQALNVSLYFYTVDCCQVEI